MNNVHQMNSVFQNKRPSFAHDECRNISSATSSVIVRLPNHQSRWITELMYRFNELTALPHGWDGYAGRPVSFECAQFAAKMIDCLFVEGISAPQIVPGGDGTLQVEWHENQYDVEIDVFAPNDVLAVRRNHRTGEVQELEFQMDFTLLSEWIADLGQVHAQARASA